WSALEKSHSRLQYWSSKMVTSRIFTCTNQGCVCVPPPSVRGVAAASGGGNGRNPKKTRKQFRCDSPLIPLLNRQDSNLTPQSGQTSALATHPPRIMKSTFALEVSHASVSSFAVSSFQFPAFPCIINV
ncbi:hypothetical protein L9F63_000646, partial [Diploptera punctata]